MKRIIVWSWTKTLSIQPILNLIDEGEVEVVLWFDREGDRDFMTKAFSYVPQVMIEQLALQDRDPDSCYHQPIENLPAEFSRFCDVYARVNYSKGLDYYDHLNLFHLYYQYFSKALDEGKVDSVVFFEPPHSGADYMLYIAARAKGINTTITFQSQVPNRFFCVRALEDMGEFATTPDVGEPIELSIPSTFKKDLFYMKKIKPKRGWMLSRFFRDLLVSSITRHHPITIAGIVQKQAGRIRFTRGYDRYAKTEIDFDKKFVYFPLHLQPELTTAVLGSEYSDQLLALERLSALLPEDWYIYAKENPKQGFQQRNRLFFERLKRLRNCIYIDSTVSTYELMKHCQFVATITGTAGWESVSGGKPALVFGYAWFKNLPGVTDYTEGTTLDEIMSKQFSHEELEVAFSAMMSKTAPGVVDSHYIQIHEGFDQQTNDQLITEFLRKAL